MSNTNSKVKGKEIVTVNRNAFAKFVNRKNKAKAKLVTIPKNKEIQQVLKK